MKYQFKGRRKMRDGSILCAPAALKHGGEMAVLSRTFPNGECWAVVVQTCQQGAILRSISEDATGWEEQWMYEDVNDALIELLLFDRGLKAEPDRWCRHMPSCRRRPGGDPTKEFVRP